MKSTLTGCKLFAWKIVVGCQEGKRTDEKDDLLEERRNRNQKGNMKSSKLVCKYASQTQ